MDEILNKTSAIAAEATYELDPCERLERWIESVVQVSQSKTESLDNTGLQRLRT